MAKNLLIIGSNSNYAIERHYLKYLSTYYNVELFDSKGKFLNYYNKSVIHKILFRLGLSSIIKTINKTLVQYIDLFQPEIILIFKGMEILPATLSYAKQKNIFLANYNPDSPFIFSGKGSGNKNVKDSISLFDLHITYDSDIKRNIEKSYNIPVGLVPFGFEIDDTLIAQVKNQQEIKKPCFVGMPDKFRAKFITNLANSGIEMDVYGVNWSKFIQHKNVTIFKPVYDNDLYTTLYKYRVQLNYMRPHNPFSHNMRTFEIPAIGGIQLASDTSDHRKYFEINKEIFTYTDTLDCIHKIHHILSLSERDARDIRTRAREKSVSSKYSYKDRATELHKILQENVMNRQ